MVIYFILKYLKTSVHSFTEMKDIHAFSALHVIFPPHVIAIDENIFFYDGINLEKRNIRSQNLGVGTEEGNAQVTKANKGRKKTRNPGSKDSKNSTIIICNYNENVKEQVVSFAERQKAKKLRFHPIMAVVLDKEKKPSKYCVFINHIYMEAESFKHALQAYMQSFFVFDLHFPKDAVKVCKFLQELFFKIPSGDTDIENFISDMKLALSKDSQ